MAFVKKTWKDRIVQYANRRLLTKSGGEVEQVIVTRDEGTVTEAGDKFDAATMNDLEDRLEYAFDNVSTAIECTQAEYDTWKNAGQLKPQTSYIITDAPNLNPTASNIEYSSGVTVYDAINGINTKLQNGTATLGSNISGAVYYKKVDNMVWVCGRITTGASIPVNSTIFSGLPLNNMGGNNVVKAIDNDGVSNDWVLYQPMSTGNMLCASAIGSGKTYVINSIYYTAS